MSVTDTDSQGSKRTMALVGLALSLFLGLVSVGRYLIHGDSLAAMAGKELVWWLYVAVILAWLRYGEHLPPSWIGIRRLTWKGLGIAVAAAVLIIAIEGVYISTIVPLFHLDMSTFTERRGALVSLPVWFRALLVLRAAVMEEIVYRGFMIEKIRQVTGSTGLAVVVSIATFTYAHLSGWGLVQLGPVFVAALILALLYVWRRDLTTNMIAHFLTDAVGLFLA